MSALVYIKLNEKLVEEKLIEYLNLYYKQNYVILYTATSEVKPSDIIITDNKEVCEDLIENHKIIFISDYYDNKKNHNNLYSVYKPFAVQDITGAIHKFLESSKYNFSSHGIYLQYNDNCGSIYTEYEPNNIIKLTLKEFMLLKILLDYSPIPVEKGTILMQVWDIKNENIETNTLETHISNIRSKFAAKDIKISIDRSDAGYSIRTIK